MTRVIVSCKNVRQLFHSLSLDGVMSYSNAVKKTVIGVTGVDRCATERQNGLLLVY